MICFTRIISNCPLLEDFRSTTSSSEVQFVLSSFDAPKPKHLSVECYDVFMLEKYCKRFYIFTAPNEGGSEPEEIFCKCTVIIEVFKSHSKS